MLVANSPAAAQGPWSVFIGGGAVGFNGASSFEPDGISTEIEFRPTSTTRLHLGAARAFGRAGVGLDISHAKAGLGGYMPGGSYSLSPGLTLYDFRLLGSYRVAGAAERASLRVGAGPMVQSWSGDAVVDTQVRLGGFAAVVLSAPLTRQLGLVLNGSLGVAGSPFTADLLAEQGPLEPVALWTREIAVAIQFAW